MSVRQTSYDPLPCTTQLEGMVSWGLHPLPTHLSWMTTNTATRHEGTHRRIPGTEGLQPDLHATTGAPLHGTAIGLPIKPGVVPGGST